MIKEHMRCWRTVAGFAIAPFVGVAVSGLLEPLITQYLAQSYPWSLSDQIWPHAGMRGDDWIPVWLRPGWLFIYAASLSIGVPALALLKRFHLIRFRDFAGCGAALGVLSKSIIIVLVFCWLFLTTGGAVAIEAIATWEALLYLLPMLTDAAMYGVAVGSLFWLIAVWRNPSYAGPSL